MEYLDMSKLHREEQFNWFKNISNATYSCGVEMDVTKLVKFSKENKQSFFIGMLYLVSKALNNIDEMRMRLVDDKPVIYETINPAFTVMAIDGVYKNARTNYHEDYSVFYKECREVIDNTKNLKNIKQEYNPAGVWNEIYATCIPWIAITQFTHPIPDDKSSQSVPRVCWGKFYEKDGKYFINVSIAVSHVFVDGYPLAKAFNDLQELINRADEILK